MAGRGGKGLAFQIEVKSEGEWEELMGKPGLCVVDVYSSWCGPCKAITSTFKRMKNEIGDDFLTFATAATDDVSALEEYRGKSEPTFMFFGSGVLMHVLRGCDCPKLISSVGDLLKTEHAVMDGKTERKVFVDKMVASYIDNEKGSKDEDEVDSEEEELAENMSRRSIKSPQFTVPKEIAVAIIKPDAVKAGLVGEIINEIKCRGVEILEQEERVLTKEEAFEFYKQHEGTEHFETLVEFMSSGPCMILVVSKPGNVVGEDIIPEFRNLIGPTDVNMAKEEAPQSLRAKYGTDAIHNALHSCDSGESAARELAFFFPDFNRPRVRKQKRRLQRTLALIRPDAYKRSGPDILRMIEESGFIVAMQKEVRLSREQAEKFYEEHVGKEYFESLISSMIRGPSLALCLAREDAVKVWRDMLGPKILHSTLDKSEDETPATGDSQKCLREMFSEPDDVINPLHGADSEATAEHEMNILFPVETTVAVIKPDAYKKEGERAEIVEKIKSAGFKISAQKEVHLTKELAAMFYKEHEGKDFFNKLTDYMSCGTTQFLILSKEDAVSGFRTLLGPAAPTEAREKFPESLRARFAKDELHNAVHGSSSATKVRDVIANFFPEVKMTENGLVLEESTVNATTGETVQSNSAMEDDKEKNDDTNEESIREDTNLTSKESSSVSEKTSNNNNETSEQFDTNQQTADVSANDATSRENTNVESESDTSRETTLNNVSNSVVESTDCEKTAESAIAEGSAEVASRESTSEVSSTTNATSRESTTTD